MNTQNHTTLELKVINLELKITKLEELGDSYFVNPMIQLYAGARRECLFCGATESRDGKVDHSYADCPVIKYQEIKGD